MTCDNYDYNHASSTNGGCNVAIINLYYSVTRTVEPMELMDLALSEAACRTLRSRKRTVSFRDFSSGVPVTNFCPPGKGASPRLQVVTCLTALADDLVVDHGHQDKEFGYYQVSLRDVNRACAHNYRPNFPKGK